MIELAEINEYIHENQKNRARKLFRILNKSNMLPEEVDALASFRYGTTTLLTSGTCPISMCQLRKLSEVLHDKEILEL